MELNISLDFVDVKGFTCDCKICVHGFPMVIKLLVRDLWQFLEPKRESNSRLVVWSSIV